MDKDSIASGHYMHGLCRRLYPYCRSLTGEGVRQTLETLKAEFPALEIKAIPSGTPAFDWQVPREWAVREAWVKNSRGEKILDFAENNLRLVGYSAPLNAKLNLAELKQILYFQPGQPDAIPYVTSYYKERSGFCLTQEEYDALPEDEYHAYIDSEFKDGALNYGEIFLPGENPAEIFFSTYLCHPSMANDDLSGPAVALRLAQWAAALPRRRYSYRFIFIPETIGSLAYMATDGHLEHMKAHMAAGFNVACVGDDRAYHYITSRYGDTLADRAAKNVLRFHHPEYKTFSFLDRGSDERQYNAPGIDLPVCAVCRSKYGEYPEYHTGKDDLGLISPAGLGGAYEAYKKIIAALEVNHKYRIKCLGEPQLGKRGLYPTVSQKGGYDAVKSLTDFIAYADGGNDLIAISDLIGVPVAELAAIAAKLEQHGLLERAD